VTRYAIALLLMMISLHAQAQWDCSVRKYSSPLSANNIRLLRRICGLRMDTPSQRLAEYSWPMRKTTVDQGALFVTQLHSRSCSSSAVGAVGNARVEGWAVRFPPLPQRPLACTLVESFPYHLQHFGASEDAFAI